MKGTKNNYNETPNNYKEMLIDQTVTQNKRKDGCGHPVVP